MIIRPITTGISNKNDTVPEFADHLFLTEVFESTFSHDFGLTGFGLITCLRGQTLFYINDQNLLLDSSSFAVVNRGSRLKLSGKSASQPVLVFFRSILADVVAAEIFHKNVDSEKEPTYEELRDRSLIEHIHYTRASLNSQLRQVMRLSQSCASFQALKTDALLRSLLQNLSEENYKAIAISSRLPVVKKSTRVDLYKRLSLAKNWMDEHLTANIALQNSAGIAMMNPEHFLRNFKTAFGITPHQYLMQGRLKLAKKLLTETSLSIQEISEQLGFEVLSSFSYQFNRQEGLSPSAYRKQAGMS
ncbi:MAG: helix-turn-helix transcriptional regulator [Roseivirga sp.]|nr:helix-turn-helix transcriptional regulator [Roseivirga sp.]